MMKYLIGLGALVLVVGGYFLLVPTESPPPPEPQAAPVAPTPITPEETAPEPHDDEAVLEDMAADLRESLPSAETDTLTMTDVLFLPRMRIMERIYVSTDVDARASASDMQALIESRAETICVEGRQMFEMGVTLRNSFEDSNGTLFQRVYLLPEDCQRFY